MKQQSYALVFIAILLLSGIVNTSSANPNNKISTDSLWMQVKKHSKTSPKLALRYAKELQGEAQKNDNQEHEANALWAIGHINKKLGDFNKSIEAYFKVLPLYRELDDSNNLAITYFNIGKIFTETKNDITAEAFFRKALSIYTRLNNERGITKTNVQLGKSYVNIEEYEKAETHLNIALTLSKDQDKKIKRKVFNWLGELERRRGNTDLASKYYNKVIKLCQPQNLGANKTKAIALLNIALTYYQNNDLTKAKEYATKSLALSRTIDIVEKQIKPQILLAEIAAKQNGGNVEEVKFLMATIGLFDAKIYNAYLQEAVYFISEKPQQKLLAKEDLMEVNSLLGTQGKLSSNLYEKTKVLLVQHSLQLSVDKVTATQKVQALEEKKEIQKWGAAALGVLFLGMLLWVVTYGKNKRRNAKKEFDVKISDAEEKITVIAAQIKKKEIENIEAEVELDDQATLNVSLAGQLKRLREENEDHAEQIEHMTTGLIESNTNMQMMNLYIWDVFKDVQRQGYSITPPPWDMGSDRDN